MSCNFQSIEQENCEALENLRRINVLLMARILILNS